MSYSDIFYDNYTPPHQGEFTFPNKLFLADDSYKTLFIEHIINYLKDNFHFPVESSYSNGESFQKKKDLLTNIRSLMTSEEISEKFLNGYGNQIDGIIIESGNEAIPLAIFYFLTHLII